MEQEEVSAEVRRLFAERGAMWYGGESVSQLEHGLQAAMFAEREGASSSLIVAALLHDIGHLLHELPEDAAARGLDDCHEQLAVTWLGARFGPPVAQPAGLHVTAKRYLCSVDASYRATLSPASIQSLRLQGGLLSPDELTAFRQLPFSEDAIQLRRWDDAAKVPGLATPSLEHFLSYFEAAGKQPAP